MVSLIRTKKKTERQANLSVQLLTLVAVLKGPHNSHSVKRNIQSLCLSAVFVVCFCNMMKMVRFSRLFLM